MERWFVGFLLGAFLSLFLPTIPTFIYIAIMLMSSVWLHIFTRRYTTGGFILGACWVLINGQNDINWAQINEISVLELQQQPIWLQGTITSLIPATPCQIPCEHTARFNFKVTQLQQQTLVKPFHLRLSWKNPPNNLKQGSVLTLQTKLKIAHGFANPGGFAYKNWLLAKELVATGYVKNWRPELSDLNNPSVRQQFYDHIYEQIKSEHKGLILALALGEKSSISSQQWQALRQTGTVHLMAISGLHLAIIASLFLVTTKLLIKILPTSAIFNRYLYYLPIVLSLLSATAYSQMAGFSTPTLRALVMLLCYWAIRLAQGKVTLSLWVLLVLFVLVLINPLMLLDTGLYWSLGAVLTIFFIVWRFRITLQTGSRWGRYCRSLLLIQAGLSCFLLPFTVIWHQHLVLGSFLVNIIVVPLMSVTVIPLTLVATLLSINMGALSSLLFLLVDFCLQINWQIIEFVSDIEPLYLEYNRTILLLTVTIPFGLLLYMSRLLTIIQLIGLQVGLVVISFATLLAFQFWQHQNNTWYVYVLDVGHGLAVVIEKNGQALLYDTGLAFPSGFNIAESVLHPFIKSRFMNQFEHTIISHQDNDHAGGLGYLVKQQLTRSLRFNFISEIVKGQPCLRGHNFHWQGLKVEVLSPVVYLGRRNDDSCTVRISDGLYSVLLPGDISLKIEQQLVYAKLPRANILIAPHHGSKSSSSESFINTVNPQYVVFSSGFMNRWHMPVAQVRQRYQQHGSMLYNTAHDGAVRFVINQTGIQASSYRHQHWPFWPWNYVVGQ